MKTVNILKDDFSIICKHCGYELGVHSAEESFCPDKNEDPYKRKYSLNIQHTFNEQSEFEEKEK